MAFLWIAFGTVYWDHWKPAYPGGLLIPATLIAAAVISILLFVAARFALAVDESAEILKGIWFATVLIVAIASTGFTLMFGLFYWPYWVLVFY
ncbi:MAG: hypothetical protein KF771_12300 [Burkholderiales bacterium]|nr:hypothetical protein [Burkholderiales bacterium]